MGVSIHDFDPDALAFLSGLFSGIPLDFIDAAVNMESQQEYND